jgi:Glu-tRNA(Gln) amidotransferase subunit E-like FAD-binding protein
MYRLKKIFKYYNQYSTRGDLVMVSIKDIPAEARWEIAPKAANLQSVVCDMLVRQIIGDKIDEIWKTIMSEGGKGSKAMAESLGLPARNAKEIEEALSIISTILLGPEFESDILEANEDRVMVRLTGCPMLNAHRTVGGPMVGTPAHCQEFCQNSVQSLNPHYTIRYSKRMCTGDPYCEYAIELKK